MFENLVEATTTIRMWAMNHRIFWKGRRAIRRAAFQLANYRYRIARAGLQGRDQFRIARDLTKQTVSLGIAAALTAVLSQLYADRIIHHLAPVRLHHLIGSNPAAYDAFLQATAGITGILLALSFAAMSTIAGALFTRAPSDIRSLLLYDEVTMFSLKGLGFITVFSLTSLGLRSLGIAQSRFVALVLLLALPIAILSMTLVARRILQLFDPTVLAGILFRQLHRAATGAQAGAHRWDDLSFQEHRRKQAEETLTTLGTMLTFTRNEKELRGDSLVRLATNLLILLPLYLDVKRRIPTDSRWFTQVPRYPDWYRASGTQLEIVTMAEESLGPAFQTDHYWVERRLLQFARTAYDALLKNIESGRPQQLLLTLHEIVTKLGAEWNLDVAGDLIRDFTSMTTTVLAATPRPADDPMAGERLVDAVTMLPAGAFLGLSATLTSPDILEPVSRVAQLRSADALALYRLNARLGTRQLLESIRATIQFERKAEGKAVTPDHQHRDALLRDFATTIPLNLTSAIDGFQKTTIAAIDVLAPADSRIAAIACDNALRTRWKIERNLERLQPVEETIRQQLRNTDGIEPWPWSRWTSALGRLRELVELKLASLIPNLAVQARPADGPDLLGEAVHRLGTGCFDALVSNRASHFATLFPHYFNGVHYVLNSLKMTIQDQGELFQRFADAILDLISLSGHARVFAALYGNRQPWLACRNEWNKYLGDPATSRSRADMLANIISNALMVLRPRSTQRHRWQMELNQLLRDLPHEERRISRSPFPDSIPIHRSALIRLLGKNDADSFGHDGANIFRDAYLRRHPACQHIDFHRDSIAESLRRFARHS